MTKEKYRNEHSLRRNKTTKFYYDLYSKLKHLFPTSFFFFGIKTRKRKLPVSERLHLQIISTYYDVYFNEFYFQNKPKYFMLSGLIEKTNPNRLLIKNINSTFKEVSESILWVWYERPSIAYFSNIRLIKMNGTGSRISKLEKRYRLNNDVNLLSPLRKFLEKIRQQHKFFKYD